MSKLAWLLLCLTFAATLLGLASTTQDDQTPAFIASAVFGTLLLLTLIVGRRIKFDPVLR
ncbi:hypothetical protein SAMN04490190_5450 [Pseudomonas libanensis]|uniref:Uncharacterized protein n=1 Tax=Pseudomonas libanensis TaxID=75588 RepID=A0A0R2Y3E2_9PSED|nr:PA3371 family protein [Pseudomonas libanensis]KRP43113.1 hypothetical protein TU73_19490 [Pseudomonas libanensis]SDL49922.1 hypothetical protein SAMN04490190_5450 [Pseudomonas libanensis]